MNLLRLSSLYASNCNKIVRLANLFAIAALEDALVNMKAPEEVQDFFANIQDTSLKGKVFAEFRKNPNLSVEELDNILNNISQELQNKEQLRLSSLPETIQHAISIVSNPGLKTWIEKVVYKKFKDDLSNRNYEEELPIIEEWVNSIDKEEIGTFNIENSSFDQLYDMVVRFQKQMQEGSQSEDKKTASIIYGPEWQNPDFNGYTIVELTEMPQLVYESECLGHCVGRSDRYYNEIKQQETRIFSLRDPGGRAVVTIDTSYDLMRFKQVFGANNSQPNGWQIAMVNEWKGSLHSAEKLYEMAQDPQNSIKVAQFVSRGVHDELIDQLLESNELGKEFLGSEIENEPKSVLQALAQNENLNAEDYLLIYNKGRGSDSILFNLARNSSIPDNLYLELTKNNNKYVRSAALSSFKIKLLSYEDIVKIVDIFNIMIVLNNPSVSSNITRRLNLEKFSYVDRNLSSEKNYEPRFINDYLSVRGYDKYVEFAHQINDFKDEDLREIAKLKGIPYNKNNREWVIERIVEEDIHRYNHDVKLHFAQNSKNPKILAQLANDEDVNVRANVALNPNTSVEILERLSNDENYFVRECVARNSNTLVEVLERLSNDESVDVRTMVALNSNASVEILAQLANDEDDFVRESVANNRNILLEVLEKLSNDERVGVRTSVALNPNTSVEILERLSNDEVDFVRANVALNPNTSVEILEKLSNYEDDFVRECVARNSKTPPQILKKLLNDSDKGVRDRAQDNLEFRGLI